jgi:hypothetical protein
MPRSTAPGAAVAPGSPESRSPRPPAGVAIRRRRSAPAGVRPDPLPPLPRRDVASSPGVAPVPLLDDAPPPRRRFRPGPTTVLLCLAPLAWGALAWIVYATSPALPAARGAFFGALFGALFCTLLPLLRAIALHLSHSRVYHQAAGFHAARQALLLAGFVVLNALLLLGRAWSELNALLLFGTFAVLEVVALSRR